MKKDKGVRAKILVVLSLTTDVRTTGAVVNNKRRVSEWKQMDLSTSVWLHLESIDVWNLVIILFNKVGGEWGEAAKST